MDMDEVGKVARFDQNIIIQKHQKVCLALQGTDITSRSITLITLPKVA